MGVVGPLCAEGNTDIMTHDLVHRTHLLIFEHYYPPVFSDWWMDDWITHVYGGSRTRKGPFRVRHMIGHQGTRYQVDQSHQTRLSSELQAGRQRIRSWLDAQAAGSAPTGPARAPNGTRPIGRRLSGRRTRMKVKRVGVEPQA